MKAILALILGIGAFTIVSCQSATTTPEVQSSETVTIAVSGMT